MNLSAWSIIISLYILASAPFMRSVLNAIVERTSFSGLNILVWILFGLASIPAGYLTYTRIIKKRRYLNLSITMLVAASGIVYTSSLTVIEERYHLIVFGLLGFLVSRDNSSGPRGKTFGLAICSTALIAILDETLQHFLPSRVGDPRDIAFGVIGGLWGAALFQCFSSDYGSSVGPPDVPSRE